MCACGPTPRWPTARSTTSSCRSRWACAWSRSGAAASGSIDPDGDEHLLPDDVLILRGAREGIGEVRELAGAPVWRTAGVDEDPAISDLDRAVDVLVEMKNLSEAAVGLAYSALLLNDQGLAAQVTATRGPPRRDARAARALGAPRPAPRPSIRPDCAGSCTSARRRRKSATPRNNSCGSSSRKRRCTPCSRSRWVRPTRCSCSIRSPRGSALDGSVVAGTQIGDDTGFHLLAIKREGRYLYRPRRITLAAGDEILATGPWEGRAVLAEQCGFRLVEDDDTGAIELVPAREPVR